MKTFDYGEYGMIEALDTTEPVSFADEHGDYVLLAEAQAIIDALTAERDTLRKQLLQVSDKPVSEGEAMLAKWEEFASKQKPYCTNLSPYDGYAAGWQARAALNQPAKPAIPEGMVLVPKAEFAALEAELHRASRKGNLSYDIDPKWDALTKAMLSAAQQGASHADE